MFAPYFRVLDTYHIYKCLSEPGACCSVDCAWGFADPLMCFLNIQVQALLCFF